MGNKKTITNKFNVYFTTIGKRISNGLKSDINPLSYIDFNQFSLELPHITVEEVICVINSLKNNSPGYDDITSHIIKQTKYNFIYILTDLINQSFTN